MSPAIEVIDHTGFTWLLGMPGDRYETYNGLTEMWVYVLEGPPFTYHYYQIPIPVFTEWFLTPTQRYAARGETETFGTQRSIS